MTFFLMGTISQLEVPVVSGPSGCRKMEKSPVPECQNVGLHRSHAARCIEIASGHEMWLGNPPKYSL